MDQLPLEKFENSRVELLVLQNSFIVSFGFLWGEVVIMGKRGSFCKTLLLSLLASCGEK
jgi:hypothetical protein